MTVKAEILDYMLRACDEAYVRKELASFGSERQVSRALAALVRELKIARVSVGIYAIGDEIDGICIPRWGMSAIAICALKKLGYEDVRPGNWEYANQLGLSTQVPMRTSVHTGNRVVKRVIAFRGDRVFWENHLTDRSSVWAGRV